MPPLAFIGLGSNLGDRRAVLDEAVAALSRIEGSRLESVSSYWETPPVGGPSGQRAFLNAAAALTTDLAPEDLLRRLHEIEAAAGRVRTVRWGERTLDLDLLLYGDRVIDEPGLQVPHPRMAIRRFVLEPLYEIAPKAVDPATSRTVSDLLANLDRRPTVVVLPGWWRSPQFWPVLARLEEVLGAQVVRREATSDPYDLWFDGFVRYTDRALSSGWVLYDFLPDPQVAETTIHSDGLHSHPVATFVLRALGSKEGVEFERVFRLPTICVETDEPEAVYTETFAACQATRSSGKPAGS
ncbi:MAG: 2-amino-4-hydroxy-6-hydroxymethyldihydropteridine diphosphokinase [Isosphaeraceae bacterium]